MGLNDTIDVGCLDILWTASTNETKVHVEDTATFKKRFVGGGVSGPMFSLCLDTGGASMKFVNGLVELKGQSTGMFGQVVQLPKARMAEALVPQFSLTSSRHSVRGWNK